jgi:hypothetical protein
MVTSSEIIERDNYVPVYDTIKEEDMITSILNELGEQNIQ